MTTERFSHLQHKDIQDTNYSSDDKPYVNLLNCLGQMSNDTFYIIDYRKWKFLHIVSNGLFLAGYQESEVLEAGFKHYERSVHQDDLKMLGEINKVGFNLFRSLPINRRLKICISYNFRIKDGYGQWMLVNHRLAPLELTQEGNIRLILCKVSIPSSSQPGNAFIMMKDSLSVYYYSEARRAFDLVKEPKLSEKAILIIKLSSQGMSESELAHHLSIDVNTVKYHKKTICKKLDVRNMSGAIQWFNNHKVIYDNF